MSDPKFTPGPWVKNKKNGRIIEHNGVKIATAEKHANNPPQAWANADLIATCPELLGLLIESQENIGGDWRVRRDAVIAKAMGEHA